MPAIRRTKISKLKMKHMAKLILERHDKIVDLSAQVNVEKDKLEKELEIFIKKYGDDCIAIQRDERLHIPYFSRGIPGTSWKGTCENLYSYIYELILNKKIKSLTKVTFIRKYKLIKSEFETSPPDHFCLRNKMLQEKEYLNEKYTDIIKLK